MEPMLLSRMSPPFSACAVVLAMLVTSCGGATSPSEQPGAAAVCEPARLDACERAIAAALAEGRPSRDAVKRTMDARSARDPADPWARLFRDLAREAKGGKAAILVEGSAPQRIAAKGATSIQVAPLPRLE